MVTMSPSCMLSVYKVTHHALRHCVQSLVGQSWYIINQAYWHDKFPLHGRCCSTSSPLPGVSLNWHPHIGSTSCALSLSPTTSWSDNPRKIQSSLQIWTRSKNCGGHLAKSCAARACSAAASRRQPKKWISLPAKFLEKNCWVVWNIFLFFHLLGIVIPID